MAYDDFETGSVNPVWTVTETGGTVAVIEAAKKNGTYGCRFTTDGEDDSDPIGIIRTGMDEASYSFYTWARSSRVDNVRGFMMVVRDTAPADMAFFQIYSNKFEYGSPALGNLVFDEVPANNTWYKTRIDIDVTGDLVSFYLYDAAGDLLESDVDNAQTYNNNIEEIDYGVQDRGSSFTVDLDDTVYGPAVPPGHIMTPRSKYWGDI